MTRMPGRPDDEPRAMNWIYDARTYGMHIRFNTVAPGMVDWSGDRISFRRVRVRVCELAEMFHGVAQEARWLLAQLAVVDGHGDRDNEHGDEHGDGYGGRSALAAALPAIRVGGTAAGVVRPDTRDGGGGGGSGSSRRGGGGHVQPQQ
ncbi:hypothetical protein CCHR01_20017 [Colletotrichum chrysophilum]|uniref:Uncharacterized protein n=1 Tax=Colletotrichum chrysophilum TaxID=1836956 RepID=A0AAD9E7B6_9PEZI|nr:hypothetical protein CCHR01_20017 [Colletotrichum chrysophilum]